MKILSGYFGELDIPDDKIINFVSSIPGFENMHKYFIITDLDEESGDAGLFCWLHSAEDGNVAFALLDVFKVMDNYQPEIEEEFLKEIAFSDGDEIIVYNIVNIPEKTNEMTVNLLAPLVINLSKKVGIQVILNNPAYSLKHRIFDSIKKATKQSSVEEV